LAEFLPGSTREVVISGVAIVEGGANDPENTAWRRGGGNDVCGVEGDEEDGNGAEVIVDG
jgi:hypothetical protein